MPSSNGDDSSILSEKAEEEYSLLSGRESAPSNTVDTPRTQGLLKRRPSSFMQLLPWLLVSIFLFTTAMLGAMVINYRSQLGGFQSGFDTELDAAKHLIQMERRPMVSEDDSKYVGEPGPEIDEAWHTLMTGLNIKLDKEDAGKFADGTFQWPEDGTYFLGVQAFHGLHCINRLRQGMDLWYYATPDRPSEMYSRGHMQHCLSYLRNYVQCHADLTPMTWYEREIAEEEYASSETSADTSLRGLSLSMNTTHTCRKWEPIHDWAFNRHIDYSKNKDLDAGGGKYRIID